jgi:hypothetical protein
MKFFFLLPFPQRVKLVVWLQSMVSQNPYSRQCVDMRCTSQHSLHFMLDAWDPEPYCPSHNFMIFAFCFDPHPLDALCHVRLYIFTSLDSNNPCWSNIGHIPPLPSYVLCPFWLKSIIWCTVYSNGNNLARKECMEVPAALWIWQAFY